MISAFLGFVFCDVSRFWTADENGQVTVTVSQFSEDGTVGIMVPVSAVFTIVTGRILYKKGIL